MKKVKQSRNLIIGRRRNPYLKALNESWKADFRMVAGVEGIDAEITLLRVLIISLVEREPMDVKMILTAMSLLARMVKTGDTLTQNQKKGFKESLGNVIKDIAVPLGVVTLSKKL